MEPAEAVSVQHHWTSKHERAGRHPRFRTIKANTTSQSISGYEQEPTFPEPVADSAADDHVLAEQLEEKLRYQTNRRQ